MRTIIIELPRPVRLSVEMAKMREWLDAQQYSPSNFRCELGPETLTFWVDFSNDRQAEAFGQHYAGRGAVYLVGTGCAPDTPTCLTENIKSSV